MSLDEYIRRLDNELRALPADERQAVLDEVRSHLHDEVEDLVGGGMDRATAELEATARFGTPEEVAAGYDVATGELRRPSSDVVLRVAKATGRGAGRAAVVVGRGVGGLVKVAAVVAVTALVVAGGIAIAVIAFADDWVPYIEEQIDANVDHPLYDRDLEQISNRTDTFFVPADAERVVIQLSARPTQGCVRIEVIDPGGATVYDSGPACERTVLTTSLAPEHGNWSIRYEQDDWMGEGSVHAWFRRG